MDKKWLVYFLDADGDVRSASAFSNEQQALEDARLRSTQYRNQYYVAKLVGRMKAVQTYELERV